MPERTGELPRRLRELRDSRGLKQRELGAALRPERPVSVALISAWESERAPALPTDAWLSSYARLFAPEWGTRRTPPRLLEDGELTSAERANVASLEAELRVLRRGEIASQAGESTPDTGALGGRFWHFPDGQPIMIIGSALPAEELRWFPYADRRHPDYMHMVRQADSGSVLELFGHLRAENPASDVRFAETPLTEDELSGHVVILGGGDRNEYAHWFAQRRVDYEDFPRAWQSEGAEGRRFVSGKDDVPLVGDFEPTFTEEVVTVRRIEPGEPDLHGRPSVVEVTDKLPELEYDIALIARQPNPLNTAATATLCYGLYGRGTYGSVRTFTDARLRESNEEYRQKRFGHLESYWMLIRILCSGPLTLTPDLNREYTRIREWPE